MYDEKRISEKVKTDYERFLTDYYLRDEQKRKFPALTIQQLELVNNWKKQSKIPR